MLRKSAICILTTNYDNFDDFIKHDMDAVVLANYANEHAPFAIRAMKLGKHVFSEVLPVQTMKEAVELIEAVEETGMLYAYGENYFSFVNGQYTSDGGTHLSAFKEGFLKGVNEFFRKNYKSEDVRDGMTVTVKENGVVCVE